ncbi:sigma 54-interacting transcriptional regulator [Fodinibius sediminis]|uniref:Sigma-54 interaction domain-containing protein n=1 Tax=Fodinibius sediminis TaxID=1214077 RepID=A0A521B4C6_9BACT|nr:sigma 54-interacting transcriptional regulator [Fodinibius sediminis]SMO41964.1 Sigma-54 interaction domain-containing protein [Fodinibius sediminis]
MLTTKPFFKKNLLHDIEKSSKSILMQDIFYKILRLAKLDSNVILVGEIGSGKKRLAKIIHENSHRAEGPFHTFYCLNIDEEEYKNAFWGRLQFEDNHLSLKYDLLEKTIDGTLYLDQFSELSPAFMLDVIISYHKGCKQLFRHRDDDKGKPRLILSLNQEFYHEILHQDVWEKLLDELNPVVIMLPPLREHKEDIPLIIDYFLDEIRTNYIDYKNLSMSAHALLACFNYDWPGNLLQLKNAILQGAILSRGNTIELRHLPFSLSLD